MILGNPNDLVHRSNDEWTFEPHSFVINSNSCYYHIVQGGSRQAHKIFLPPGNWRLTLSQKPQKRGDKTALNLMLRNKMNQRTIVLNNLTSADGK